MVQVWGATSRQSLQYFRQVAWAPGAAAVLGGGSFCLSSGNKAEKKEQRHPQYWKLRPEAHFHPSFTSSRCVMELGGLPSV